MRNLLSIVLVILIGLLLTFNNIKDEMSLPVEDKYVVNEVAWLEKMGEELLRWIK